MTHRIILDEPGPIGEGRPRVEVSRPIIGAYGMQVCAVKDATDDEILEVCNRDNPSGTTNGWGRVYRSDCRESGGFDGPVQCGNNPDRLHFLVSC